MLALVVRHAAAVPAVGALRQPPGREARFPIRIEAADDVAVPVAEHGRALALDALGIEERALGLRLGQNAAGESESLEGRLHLGLDITGEFGRALRILALGRDGDAAREVLREG